MTVTAMDRRARSADAKRRTNRPNSRNKRRDSHRNKQIGLYRRQQFPQANRKVTQASCALTAATKAIAHDHAHVRRAVDRGLDRVQQGTHHTLIFCLNTNCKYFFSISIAAHGREVDRVAVVAPSRVAAVAPSRAVATVPSRAAAVVHAVAPVAVARDHAADQSRAAAVALNRVAVLLAHVLAVALRVDQNRAVAVEHHAAVLVLVRKDHRAVAAHLSRTRPFTIDQPISDD